MKPTPEQEACLTAAVTGEDLVIEAGAGTGKTSTLRLISGIKPTERGIYLAYNRAIADDAARSFPANVQCATAHSFAYRAIGNQFRDRLNGPRIPAHQTARILGITSLLPLGGPKPERIISPLQLARIVMETIGKFCYSAAESPGPEHVPQVTGLDDPDQRKKLVSAVVPLAQIAWRDISSIDGRLRFSHDCYLKIWQLSRPRLPADFIFLDEAQDANPVISAIVSHHEGQRILVGDQSQAIYGWRGAVDAMGFFDGKRLTLSQSFRFGPAVAEEANKWLQLLGAPLKLTGYDQIPSRLEAVTLPRAILCRSNAAAINECLEAGTSDRKPALVGGGEAIKGLARAAITLRAGCGTDHPELFVFRTWSELEEYVVQDQDGSDLKVFVDLINKYGPEDVIDIVDHLYPENAADVVVSTAHKAKGREWESVRISGDFTPPAIKQGEPHVPERAEAMLAYVSVTEAKMVLDRGGLFWIDQMLPMSAERPVAQSRSKVDVAESYT